MALDKKKSFEHNKYPQCGIIRPVWRRWWVEFMFLLLQVLKGETVDVDLHVLREGCFAYFERGGDCINGPVSLLAG